jgi:hypothetical protein
MKTLSSRETRVVKLTKKELETVMYIIGHSDDIPKQYDITVHADKLECIIVQLTNEPIDTLTGYFEYCFTHELMGSVLRKNKLEIIKSNITSIFKTK